MTSSAGGVLVFRAAFPLPAMLLLAYFVTAPFGVPVSVVTGTGAVLLLALAGWLFTSGSGAVLSVGMVFRGAPRQIVVFSLGMYLLV